MQRVALGRILVILVDARSDEPGCRGDRVILLKVFLGRHVVRLCLLSDTVSGRVWTLDGYEELTGGIWDDAEG